MGDIYWAHEKFGAAVRYLAVYGGPRRDLLSEARSMFSPITENDLPQSAIEDFRAINHHLTFAEDTTGEGTVIASLKAMSEADARAIANLIVSVYVCIQLAIFDAHLKGERLHTQRDGTEPTT